jgi:hypothetical protein
MAYAIKAEVGDLCRLVRGIALLSQANSARNA